MADGPLSAKNAGKLRNKCSQLETSQKKRKVELSAAEATAISTLSIAEVIGGQAAVNSSYINARHQYGQKGRAIGPQTRSTVQKIFRGSEAGAEAVVCQDDVLPKYNVGPGHDIGTYLSPRKFTVKQATVIGMKKALPDNIDPARAQRMADMGVSYLTFIENELRQHYYEQAQNNPGGLAAGVPVQQPSRDEVKAAYNMALILGWDNKNLAPQNRTPVDKDMAGIKQI